MIVKLLTERHLEFLSLTGGCRGSSESRLVKMSNCWKSHAAALVSFLAWKNDGRGQRANTAQGETAEEHTVDELLLLVK